MSLAVWGGAAGSAASVAYALKMLVEARKENSTIKSTPVSDAATANTILLNALQEERAEVQRLSVRVDDLQEANTQLYEQMTRQRREYEEEVRNLREQLSEFSARLEHLQTRLQNDTPLP